MSLAAKIKSLASELGFDEIGITRPESLEEGEKAIAKWVSEGRHGSMAYLENFSERRARFYQDFPDAKSVIVLGVNYYTSQKSESRISNFETNSNGFKIQKANVSDFGFRNSGLTGKVARYAWGKDYHHVIAARHQQLIQKIAEISGESFRGKSCVDTQPIPERFAAVQSGLGFIGKHTGVLSQKFGPWLFLSEIVTNLDLAEDLPYEGNCGTCTDCQKICPTGALDEDYEIDARLCIAYLTIEHKGIIPRELRPKIKNWVFGCDECFAVCPFTSKIFHPHPNPLPKGEGRVRESQWPEFRPEAGMGEELDLAELFQIQSNSDHEKKFSGTALLRTNRKQMLRNACIVLGNSGDPKALPYLKKGLEDSAPLVRLHAAWGLGRLGAFPEARPILLEAQAREKDPEVIEEIRLALASF